MNVAIVGLGMAGMRAAMLLERAGAEVQLYEARLRLGGRMETSDHGNGAVYESGGEWIDGDHARCLGLLEEMEMEPEPADSRERRFLFRGEQCTTSTLWPDALEDELRFDAAAREMCRDLRQPPWSNGRFANLDRATLANFIDEHAMSPRGRWLLTARALSDEGDDPDRIGLLGWLTFSMNYLLRQGDEMSAFRIPGGAHELFHAMAATLEDDFSVGKDLVRVSQEAGGVRLGFSDGSTADADRAVLTLPPRPLERIVFDPPLSPSKRCAIEACRMSPTVKVCLEFDSAWWEDLGWNGSMQCDSAIQQTWDGTRGTSPILTCYVCGRAARSLAHDPNAIYHSLEALCSHYPQARACFERGWMHDWVDDPFSGGGFSHVAPGYVLEHMRHIGTPEGRVHFAGEHTSLWTGFIEGALESAERVTAEILG